MRRVIRASVALAVLAVVMGAVPPTAHAQDAEISLTGTYAGAAVGSGTKDKTAGTSKKSSKKSSKTAKPKRTAVQIHVIQEGDQLTVTVVAAVLPAPVTFTAGPVVPSTVNDWTAPFTIDEPGITGSGVLSFSYRGNAYLLAGSGRGKAFGYRGTGRVAAQRQTLETKSAATLLAEGAGDMVGSLLGGPGQKSEPPPPAEVEALLAAETSVGTETDIDKTISGPAPETPGGEPSEPSESAAPAEDPSASVDQVEQTVYAVTPAPFTESVYVVMVLLLVALLMVLAR